MTHYVTQMSGGGGSWMAARRVVDSAMAGSSEHRMTLLFANVKGSDNNPYTGEHPDTYRFLRDATADLGQPLVEVRDGRDIWDVFYEKGWLGNSSLSHCSWELKTRPCRNWLDANCDIDDAVVVIGMDWTETRRHAGVYSNYSHTAAGCAKPRQCASLFDDDGRLPGPGCKNLMWEKTWRVEMPMNDRPKLAKPQVLHIMRQRGLKPPWMYEAGFAHANCVGCVKGGWKHWERVYWTQPSLFRYHALREQEWRESKPSRATNSILKDRSDAAVHGTKARPLSLVEFADRLEQANAGSLLFEVDQFDEGGCGCFTLGADPGLDGVA